LATAPYKTEATKQTLAVFSEEQILQLESC